MHVDTLDGKGPPKAASHQDREATSDPNRPVIVGAMRAWTTGVTAAIPHSRY